MSRLADALRDPLPLAPNRLARFYRSGRQLDDFRGTEPAGEGPEDWVGSATRTWTPPGAEPSPLGPSPVEIDGRRLTLPEILEQEPAALAGRTTLGVLVKLLDAGQRLPVHCHPTRELAATLLGSPFGKTEAWLILGTEDPAGAGVWAGWREPVAQATLRDWIERQATDELLAATVAYRVTAGDVLLIPAGTPHAIGAGIFLLELQEPSDFSVVAETRGFPIDANDASLGLGWERAVGFFTTDPTPDLRQAPREESAGLLNLLGAEADPFFRALRMRLDTEATPPFEPAYAVGVVLDGTGVVRGTWRELPLRRGVTFALPAAATRGATLHGDSLDLVWCLGP